MNPKVLLAVALLLLLCAEHSFAKKFNFVMTMNLSPVVRGDLPISFGIAQNENLTTVDKQRILDMHNSVRLKLATGKESKGWDGAKGYTTMPKAANMQAMEWDDTLADYAQNWASQCINGHSNIQHDLKAKRSQAGNVAENLCGGISFVAEDMYGEVRWWSYAKYRCQANKQCGHYIATVASAMNHVGCGWKTCPPVDSFSLPRLTLVCVIGGFLSVSKEEGKKRLPWQHEYLAGPPCSACEQGWDYCMGGGLCATKKQCESDPSNKCTCNHDEMTCLINGGTFDANACTCTCPPDRMGINCAKKCQNTIPESCGMKCSDSHVINMYHCQKTCNGCGKAISPAYKFYFIDNKASNKYNIKVRHQLENPDNEAKSTDLSTKKTYGKCKNQADNTKCEILFRRNYCRDTMFGKSILPYCGLSCEECPKKKAAALKKKTASNDIDLSTISLKGFQIVGAPASGSSKKKASTSGSVDLSNLLKGFNMADTSSGSSKTKKASTSGSVDLSNLLKGFNVAGTSSSSSAKKEKKKKASTSGSVDVNNLLKGFNVADTSSGSSAKKEEKKKKASTSASASAAGGFSMGDGSAMSADMQKLLGGIDWSKVTRRRR